MKSIIITLFFVLISLPYPNFTQAKTTQKMPHKTPSSTSIWVTAYYPGWRTSLMPVDQIDLGPITHLVYFSLIPTADNKLDGSKCGVTDATAMSLSGKVHKEGKKALICIGGANSASAIRPAIKKENRTEFIKNIIDWIDTHHFDGVDIDMEPVEEPDLADYQAFIVELHDALKAKNTSYLLTAAVGNDPKCCLGIADKIDQINIMTYDMSGPWEGWTTWYNGALYNKKTCFPNSNVLMPSVEKYVKNWTDAGVALSKLGVGIAFYGYLWRGASGPNQSIAGVTREQIPYSQIMKSYYTKDRYHWDADASAPYLGQDDPDPTKRTFLSYDDERLCRAKLEYARKHQLGGVIIWELGSGYLPDQPDGKRQPLLDALK